MAYTRRDATRSKVGKLSVFVSHMHEDAPVARLLSEYLERGFARALIPFVSSERTSIPLGVKWLARIEDALRDCRVAIVLASPSSVARPWVNFEAGAAWMRGVRIIPVCIGGMRVEALPQPLRSLQACEVTSKEELGALFCEIAAICDLQCAISDWSEPFERFLSVVRSQEIIEDRGPRPPGTYDWIYEIEDKALFGAAVNLLSVREACCEDLWRVEKNPGQVWAPSQTECRTYSSAVRRLKGIYGEDFPFDPLDDGEGYNTTPSPRWLLTLCENALRSLRTQFTQANRDLRR